MKNYKLRSKQKGFSALELGAILVAAALILIGVIAGLPGIFDDSKSRALTDALTGLGRDAQSWAGGSADLSALSSAVLIDLDKSPGLVNSAGTGFEYVGLNAPIVVQPGNINGGTDNAIEIEVSQIPPSICDSVVKRIEAFWGEIDVNTNAVKTSADATIDPNTVSTECRAAALNTVTFRGFLS